ncbi:MAG: DivIVA domain-containing protein [Deltaproteobacteria bacterium]|nr:DivIVA domain-containing protein [Deltaproteobacteria bacterium]
MKLTPMDIQQQKFTTRVRGFDSQEVDRFLEEVASGFEELLHENEDYRKEIQNLKLESQEYKNREETFKRIMLNSQKVIDQMKDNANKSSDLIIAKAEVSAEHIVSAAHKTLAKLHDEIAELKRQHAQFEIKIKSAIESHTKLLELSKEELSKY